jgi:hypoxanthine phosphoribosyltransferase
LQIKKKEGLSSYKKRWIFLKTIIPIAVIIQEGYFNKINAMKSIPDHMLGEIIVDQDKIGLIVNRVAKNIYYSRDYIDNVPILLCLREGAVPFFNDLKRELDLLHFAYDSAEISAKSYKGTKSSGTVEITSYSGPPLQNRSVIIVEDVIDSSTTIIAIFKYLASMGVCHQNICTLLFKEKPENSEWRKTGLDDFNGYPEIRYVGIFISDQFIVGYGLDYRNFGRDCNEIRVLKPQGQGWVEAQFKKQ